MILLLDGDPGHKIVRRINSERINEGKYYKITSIEDGWVKMLWVNKYARIYDRYETERIENLEVVNA